MKNSKLLYVSMIALLLCLVHGNAAAQGIPVPKSPTAPGMPQSLPISLLMLKAHVLTSQNLTGEASVMGTNIIHSPGEDISIHASGTCEQIISQLSSASNMFKFRVASASGITCQCSVKDSAGYTLLQSDVTPVNIVTQHDGSRTMVPVQLVLKMATVIPVELPDVIVSAAEILHQDQSGMLLWSEKISFTNGPHGGSVLYFPIQSASVPGTLVITTKYPDGVPNSGIAPGTEVLTGYDLSSGSAVLVITVTGKTSCSIQNHVTANDTGLQAGQTLTASLNLVAPSVDQTQIVAPPSATFTISQQVGTTRSCTFQITTSDSALDLTNMQAYAFIPSETQPNGSIAAIMGSVNITSPYPRSPIRIITISWPDLYNDLPNGSTTWYSAVEIPAYNNQMPPQAPPAQPAGGQ